VPHLHRFLVALETPRTGSVALSSEESHHALHGCRVRTGDAVVLIDGQGGEWEGRIASTSRREVQVEVSDFTRAEPPGYSLTLVQAWPNRDRTVQELVQHGTEVGVTAFRFFRAHHSDRPLKHHDKWTRWAVEAVKQCGRLWVPSFEVVQTLAAGLEGDFDTRLITVIGDGAVPLREALQGNRVALVVGPEGDLSDDEIATARNAGATPIGLGSTVFRTEMAVTLAAAFVVRELGALGE
jgi:16S rRNA (uracil1498-N3)-methyltransferase